MYSKQVADHVANPRNVGELENPTGTGDVTNEVCMDRIRLTIRVDDGRLAEAKVKASGCPPTIAAASVLTELIVGRELGELQSLGRKEIIDALGHLPATKKHSAALAVEALQAAIKDSQS
ncbi:MAG TPA: iron-sulfur cluster assembly scaffold protein [Blastocatellia bacterium]|nr:iron-sulfur cluster assembly scaffold protein [Blastocatellia bacterium]